MTAILKIKNDLDLPLKDIQLKWAPAPGIEGGSSGLFVRAEAPRELPAQGSADCAVTLETTRGARFGFTPLTVVLQASAGKVQRSFMESFEVVVAPLLKVVMDPIQPISARPGDDLWFQVRVSNKRVIDAIGVRANWPSFLSHRSGPCRGTVSLDLPRGMENLGSPQPFELAKNDHATLIFKVKNNSWDEMPVKVRPEIRLEGWRDPIDFPARGTTVIRNRATLEYKPLNADGLLFYFSCDSELDYIAASDPKSKRGRFFWWGDSAFPNPFPIGVKGRCMPGMGRQFTQFGFASLKNIECRRGTVCLWLRKEPGKRNEMGKNRREEIFGPKVPPTQERAEGTSGVTLWRHRAWDSKPGYLQLEYQGLGKRFQRCQARFDWTEKWRHAAYLWDTAARRLELYLDGKLADKVKPDGEPWYPVPWDDGTGNNARLTGMMSEGGAYNGTQRDEIYIYNRPLTVAEIRENMAKARDGAVTNP